MQSYEERISQRHLLQPWKRAVIETVNDELKNICQIDHTRHRSVNNLAANLLAGMIAYNLIPKKPSLNIEIIDKSRLIA